MSDTCAGRELAKWVSVTAGAMAFYVLSIGPASWMFEKTGWNHPDWRAKAAEAIYFPVAYFAEATGNEEQISRYIGLFVASP